ncbi:MAG: pyruvate kinase [Ilumatobacter sp.]
MLGVARRTKIIATIGPASSDDETLASMMRAGMDVARISIAHTPIPTALEKHRRIRRIADELGMVVATMIDLPGPMIRIGRTPREGMELETGATVVLVGGNEESSAERIYVDYSHLIDDSHVGDRISIGDGEEVVVEVQSVGATEVTAIVVSGGPLNGRSGVNIPFATNDLGAVSDSDRKVVDLFVAEGVDIVAVSVRNGGELRSLGLEPHPRGPMLFAKIESAAAVPELESIIKAASGVLVARGGLGMETPQQDLPHLQKSIIRDCIAGGLPVITAGQMLVSMVTAPTPTRAEATDIANAVFDGTSAVMLSAETAIGDHPVATVAMMARIAETADDRFDHTAWAEQVAALRMTNPNDSDATTITDAITIAAARAAESANVKAILCVSESGFTVRSMARFRPSAQILGFSPNERTVRQLASSWGVAPVLLDTENPDYVERVRMAVNLAKREGHVAAGDLIGVVAGISRAAQATDTFRLLRVG